MTDQAQQRDPPDRAHLERSRRVWDRWSDHYDKSEDDYEPMRETAMTYLDVGPGDTVLDIGCGPGVNFATLSDAVGPEGRVVAVDYSPEMVERARDRIAEHGLDNVTVRRADATTADFGECDAALATLSMSVMPDIERAARNVYGALATGGRFVVFDVRPIPAGPLRVLNPLVRRFIHWYANWNTGADVLPVLERTFDETQVVETYFAGANYTVVAERVAGEHHSGASR